MRAKSIINRVPGRLPGAVQWTVNPYRGCTHACVYCFARNTHTYLDLDTGVDFDSKIIVKVNAGELVRRELAAPRWRATHIAMGTNVDCYQRAEGRYRLMPRIIEALRDFANPFSILTKGTLILRDLPLLAQAAEVTRVGLPFSVGFVDERRCGARWSPAPQPAARLDARAPLADAGIEVRGADGADPARPQRRRRVDRRHRRGDRRRRRHRASPRWCCTCAPAPASGMRTGSAGRSPTWSPAIASCTGPGPTRRRRTSGS